MKKYKATVQSLLPHLTAANLATAVAIANIPEEIRGYGHVKERHLLAAQQKEAALLQQFNQPAPSSPLQQGQAA